MIPETSTKLLRNVRHNGLGKAFTLDVPAGYGSQRLEATSWNINRVATARYGRKKNSPELCGNALPWESESFCSPTPEGDR